MTNPFTDLSRDERIALNIKGLCTHLRCPEQFVHLVHHFKPEHISMGSHMIACLLDNAIDTLKMQRKYKEIHSLIGTMYGLESDTRH